VLAFRLWPTTFTGAPFRLQNICRSGVPPRSGTTTALLMRKLWSVYISCQTVTRICQRHMVCVIWKGHWQVRTCAEKSSYITCIQYSTIQYNTISIIKADMFVCLSQSMFRIAGQTAGPIETKLDTRTHVHPGSVSGKVNVKVIRVCVRDWQKYETPGMRHLANGAHTTSGRRRRRHLANDYETPSNYSSSNEAPTARVELRPEDG